MDLEKITLIKGRGIFIPGDDIDTDRIIPARYLKCITFNGLGRFAFFDERFGEDGGEKPHPMNDPRFKGASILLCGSNFGCGSSREHAPQSIFRYGIRALVGVSFAEIFFGNAINLGMPCLTAKREDIENLAAEVVKKPSLPITVEIAAERVRFGAFSFPASLPKGTRESLVEGRWDPLSELLEGSVAVDEVASALPYAAAG